MYMQIIIVGSKSYILFNLLNITVLDSLVVMPLPQNLQTLSLSFNHFRNLPDWISDCPNLTFLRANNNSLVALPERLV